MKPESLLALDRVSVGYDRHAVLSGVNLALARGSFTGLLGANGSGKTTLLRTILGLLPPLAGSIDMGRIDGRAPALGYVPQRETLDSLYLFNALEVVLMGAYGRIGPGRRVGRDERDFARACLAETEALDLERRRFSELSGGQKQRVLIARALATNPDFLLLDEPTAGIDAAASQTIMELLRRIHQQHRMTLLLVNHDLPAMRRQVQDVIWVHRGKVEQGTVETLLSPEKIEEILELKLNP